MESESPVRLTPVQKLILILLFIAAGSLIIVVFSPWRPLLKLRPDYYGRFALLAFFGLIYWLFRRSPRLRPYSQIVLGLLILALVFTLDWFIGRFYYDTLNFDDKTPAQWAVIKANEWMRVWPVIVVCTLCAGGGLGSIYLQRGKLKLGLIIGFVLFLAFLLTGIPVANALFQGKDLTLARVLPWTPWLLIYCIANGANEELMFRGLFLKKLEPFLGKFLSNLMVALVFTLIHQGANYTSSTLMFLAVTFPLALLLGWLTQKTNALWASILLHAGMDNPVMIGIFSNL